MAYDVLLANLAPELERRGAPADVREALAAFPDGLTTRELAELSATGPALEVDVAATEDALLELVAGGAAAREPLGDDALWLPSSATRAQRAADGRFAHA
jgi:hypothetical protein